MNVIHVTYDASPYGIATFLFHILDFQKKNYKDIKLAVAFHAAHVDIEKYKEILDSIYCLGKKSARDIRLFFGFYKIFKSYDIVNLHTFSPWAFLAAWASRKKTIYVFHGAFGFKKKRYDFLLKLFYFYVINKLSKKIVFASKTSLSIYLNRLKCKLPNKKIALFPYGLQIGKIKSQRSRESVRSSFGANEKFIIGTAARMDPVKRIELLIDALASLDTKADFELWIAGSGDKNYQDCLVSQVKILRLEDRVRFLGYREDILDVIGALDLFVLPGHGETFGLALLEAMALGVPSAVFEDGGGVVDIIGENGFVVKSIEELSQVMLKVKTDSLLWNTISQQVKERALMFDIKQTAKNLYQIYAELLAERQ